MPAFPWGALISAGGGLASSLFGSSAASSAAKQQQQALQAQNAAITKLNKNKIQWTVADANKAGIHPLAALGSPASGAFASPVSTFGGQGGSGTGSAVGDALAQFGRDIQAAQLENAQLQNEKTKIEIERQRLALISDARSRSAINDATASGRGVLIDGKLHPFPPGMSTGQVWEDYFGEAGDWMSAVINIPPFLENQLLAPLSAQLKAGVVKRFNELKRGLQPKR